MSLETILAILAERGLSIQVDLAGKPRLIGKKEEMTEGVREAVSAYREEIIARFRPKPRREFLWRLGHRYTDVDGMPDTWFPVGAWWWKFEGETEWQAIPGRPGEAIPPPCQ